MGRVNTRLKFLSLLREGPCLYLLVLAHLSLLVASILWNPMSWDEGWNFCVAKNWVTFHHYGCSLLGIPTGTGLSTGLVSVAPTALGFKLFGIGIWQGRALAGIESLLFLGVVYLLSSRLFSRRVGVVTLAVLLFCSPDQRLHPMTLGGQGWGEMPMLLALFVGLLLLSTLQSKCASFCRGVLIVGFSGLMFSTALFAKLQLQPFFWTASLVTLLTLLRNRHFRESAVVALLMIITWWMHQWFLGLKLPQLPHTSREALPLDAMREVLALVFVPEVRLHSALYVVEEAWYLPLGLIALAVYWSRSSEVTNQQRPLVTRTIILFLFALSALWFGWFLLAAVTFPRYLAPAIILASPLVAHAAILYLHGGGGENKCWASFSSHYAKSPLVMKGVGVAIGIAVILHCARALHSLPGYLIAMSGRNVETRATAAFINKTAPPDSLVETYDSQLLFLLDRPYHYPPDYVHVKPIARLSGKSLQFPQYDPFDQNPDYFVIGPWGRGPFGEIYRDVESGNRTTLVKEIGAYKVFRRLLTESERPR